MKKPPDYVHAFYYQTHVINSEDKWDRFELLRQYNRWLWKNGLLKELPDTKTKTQH